MAMGRARNARWNMVAGFANSKSTCLTPSFCRKLACWRRGITPNPRASARTQVLVPLRLRTFGGLSIEADSGGPPPPSLGPRRLALCAVVAAAGSRGVTRENILGILWAETGEEQARHTLSQNLY